MEKWGLASSLLQLLGSILVLYPAYRASSLMKESYPLKKLKELKERDASINNTLDELVGALELDAHTWNPTQHYCLIIGISLIVIGNLINIFI